jgi:hypothetical protein
MLSALSLSTCRIMDPGRRIKSKNEEDRPQGAREEAIPFPAYGFRAINTL